MHRCKICSESYLDSESLVDHQLANHTPEALEAFDVSRQSSECDMVKSWQSRSTENKSSILNKLGYTPQDIQTLIGLEYNQLGKKLQQEVGESLAKTKEITQEVKLVESDENKTYQNMYDSYLKSRSAQIKKPFQDGTESLANEDDDYEYGFIPKVSGFGEDKDKNLPIKDHTHNFTSGYQHSNGIDYIWQCSDSGCGATKNQDLYMESKASEYNNPNIEWTGDDYHTSEWSCKICGETGDNLNFGATISNIEDHLKTHGIGEARVSENRLYSSDELVKLWKEFKADPELDEDDWMDFAEYNGVDTGQAFNFEDNPVAFESKASEADWDHLTAEDEVELDRNIETLKTAFYKALGEEDSVNSTRILGELERLREIKTTRFGSEESKASEDWDTDMEEKANKNMKKQFGDFYDPNFNAMDVPPEPKQQSVKDILADFRKDMEQFDESKASEKGETYHFMWNHKQVRSQLLAQAGLSDEHSNKEWNEIPEEDKTILKLIMNDLFYSNDYDTESKASEYTLEDLERVGIDWDNSSVAERKQIIIDTHNGYTEGHDDNIVKNWNELSNHTRTIITQGKSNESKASEGFDQGLFGYVDAKCKTCGVEFDSIPDMDDHYKNNPDHTSNIDEISQIIPNTESLGEALKSHTDYHKLINSTLSGETTIPCSKCAKKFKAQENLDIHYNDSHADSELKSLIGELKANEDDLEDARTQMKQGKYELAGLGDYNPNDSEDAKTTGLGWQEGGEVDDEEQKYLDGVIEDWAMQDLDDEENYDQQAPESKANEEIEYTGGDFCDKCGTEFEDRGECKKCSEESMVEDIIHKTESGVDITHPQDEWCELCDEPTTSFEVSDDEYDEKVEDLMEEEGVDEITDFDEEEKKDFFEDVDDIKVTDEEQTEDGEAVGLSNNWDDDEKRMDGDTPQIEDNPYPTYTGDARDQMQNDIKDLSNPNDITTDIKGKPWQDGLEYLTEEQELQQARESLAPLNKLDDEKSNVTKAFESGASVEDIYSKVGDTTQDRGSEDDLTDIYNQVDVKLNLEKV